MLIFGSVFNTGSEKFYFGVSGLQYYVPTIAGLSVLSACYAQLATALSLRRQTGILKRIRATPCPAGPTSAACWPTAS
jgi:ABC-2 type transport system permease protein